MEAVSIVRGLPHGNSRRPFLPPRKNLVLWLKVFPLSKTCRALQRKTGETSSTSPEEGKKT